MNGFIGPDLESKPLKLKKLYFPTKSRKSNCFTGFERAKK